MKSCYRCGTPWRGYGAVPRAREVCAGCGGHLHSCLNCHHYDRQASSCKLKETSFIGSKTALNYCDYFQMTDSIRKDKEARVNRARDRWEALFGH